MMAVSLIIKSLTELRNTLNIDRNMSEQQIAMCAEAIVDSDEFYMLRAEDFDLCFRKAAQGAWGEFYGRLDQPMVFAFIRKYSIERDAAIARKRDTESDRSNVYDIFQTEPMQKILADVNSKLLIKEQENQVQQPKPERKLDIYQLCMREFDNLHQTNSVANSPIKTIMYNNKEVDINGYIVIRVAEMINEM
jgi:hypothetical protein